MTLGLCIISPDWATAKPVVEMYKSLFDEVYVQLNGKQDKNENMRVVEDHNIHYSYFKWNNNFDDARNALLKEVKTDFWAWIDTDDTINNPEAIRPLALEMEAKGIDKMFALYEYAKNDLGEEIGAHWRERIIKTSHPYTWLGVVHETLISPIQDTTAKTEQFSVIHHKDQADFDASIKRNHKILEAEYKKGDPRITMYLGMSFFTMRQWERSIELLVEHIQTSGSVEDKYRSWIKIAECHAKLGNLDKSVAACLEAIKLIPSYPDAYFAIGQFYYELGDYARCLEWLKIGADKPDPITIGIVDPTLRYRSLMMGALAEFQLGRVKDAWLIISKVLDISPDYAIAKKFYPIFEQAYLESEAIDHTKWLTNYAKKYGGKPINVLKALPDALALDIRLNGVRNALYPPKVWPKHSIVFFCGPTSEEWGPDMLDKGIGGSEEAIIYLSRTMSKLGWAVTVYNDREDGYFDEANTEDLNSGKEPNDWSVRWLPWHTFNPKDKFDVLVAWRSATFFSSQAIQARLKCVDLHDTPIGSATIKKEDAAEVDKFFFKSQVQREMAENVPDDKVVIISNGIVAEQFTGDK